MSEDCGDGTSLGGSNACVGINNLRSLEISACDSLSGDR